MDASYDRRFTFDGVLDESMVATAMEQGVERFVVGAVIHRDRAALVVTRSATDDFLPGVEEVPSGGVEDGESLHDALDRELREEVGFGAEEIDSGFLARFDYVSGSGRPTRQFTVSVPLTDRQVRLSAEHSSFRWVDRSELDATRATAETRGVLAEWFDWVTQLSGLRVPDRLRGRH